MTENECVETLQYLLGYENAVDKGELESPNNLNSQEKEALQMIIEEIQQYRAIGTVEELLEFKEKKQNKCKDCAGCTSWLCECANERGEAIDEFAEALKKEISFKYGSGQINRAYNAKEKTLKLIDEIAEQLKGGAE